MITQAQLDEINEKRARRNKRELTMTQAQRAAQGREFGDSSGLLLYLMAFDGGASPTYDSSPSANTPYSPSVASDVGSGMVSGGGSSDSGSSGGGDGGGGGSGGGD